MLPAAPDDKLMSELPAHPLLEQILRSIPRPYRLPALQKADRRPSTLLAFTLEQARRAQAAGEAPDAGLEHSFIDAIAALIRDALQEESGDPAFQAMALKHGSPTVREHAALSSRLQHDRRRVHNLVNAFAHPAKLQRLPPGVQRSTLAQLHAAVSASAWPAVLEAINHLLAMQVPRSDTGLTESLKQLKEEPALQRLQQLEALQTHEEVQQYLSLWEQQGPTANSRAAAREGAAGRRRGINVETLTKHALQALAQRLNEAQPQALPYRVVSSLHVPASFPNRQKGAKTEWDAVLLRQAPGAAADTATTAWDICLLVEAKASADAAGTDLPRLLRGLRLLAQADPQQLYSFKAREGLIPLRGESLSTLPTDAGWLQHTVLYCSNDSNNKEPRLLSAAARMQLLSAPQSLQFATALKQGQPVDTQCLQALWQEILNAGQWHAVLHQYETLRQARELMVHTDDLLQAAGSA